MEVNAPPPPQPQQPITQAVTTTDNAGAVKTDQTSLDNVVTATAQINETNVRGDDALPKRNMRAPLEDRLPSMSEMRLSGIQGSFDYDIDNNVIFLEIKFRDNDEVYARIPSEELLEFMAAQSQQRQERSQEFMQSLMDQSI